MKLTKFFTRSPDIAVTLLTGLIALATAQVPQLAFIRVLFGFLFSFLASGYPLTRLLPQDSSIPERLIVSALGSLLLLYPAAVLTVLYEGQSPQAIFGGHLTHSLTSLFLLSFLLAIFIPKRRINLKQAGKFPKLLLIPLVVFAFLTFTNLNRADVFGDEYDLGYQAYDLVDGIRAGRKALTISFSGHPPLAMDIKHFSMNILEPNGLDLLEDWQFRVSEGLVGLLTLIAAYLLAKELFSEKVAIITAALLAVNNYMVWMGRIFHREMYLTFFMTAGVYLYLKVNKRQESVYPILAGLAFGAGTLVKETGLFMLAIPATDILFSPKDRNTALRVSLTTLTVFLPVIAYNLVAFVFTGYADVFFSNLFGVSRPGATTIHSTPILNLYSILSYLLDIYSPLMFEILVLGVILSVVYQRLSRSLMVWLVVGLMFFTLTSVRAYYFLFLTIPLAISASAVLSDFAKNIRTFILVAVLGYSLFYSVSTNLYRGYSISDRVGTIDESMVVKRTPFQHYSIAARSWSEEVGYKRLQSALDQTVRSGDCVIVSESINPLAVRRYLGLNDELREFYLGQEYLSRYPSCPDNLNRVQGRVFMVSEDRDQPGSLIMTVSDHLGNPSFYIYLLIVPH